jgi:hypothetical protein
MTLPAEEVSVFFFSSLTPDPPPAELLKPWNLSPDFLLSHYSDPQSGAPPNEFRPDLRGSFIENAFFIGR